jgi:hypothetical protein
MFKTELLCLVADSGCAGASGWRGHEPAHKEAYPSDRAQVDGYHYEYARMGADRREHAGPSARGG